MKKRILTFFFLLGLILLLLNTNLSKIIENIKFIPLRIFIFTLFLQIITILTIGVQWKSIIDITGLTRKFYNVLKVNLKGNIFDAITPGSKVGGELVRIYEIKNNLDISFNNSIVILGLQKSISIFSILSLGLISLLFFYKDRDKVFINKNYYYILLFVLLLGLLFILAFILNPIKIKRIINKYNFKKKDKVNNFLDVYIKNIEKIKNNKKKLVFNGVLGLFIWVLYAIKLVILVRIFTNDISLFKLGAITYISYLIGGIPLLPGGIGTFESALGGLLYISGLNMEESMVVAITFRFITFWFEFLISGIVILLDKIFNKKIKGEEYA